MANIGQMEIAQSISNILAKAEKAGVLKGANIDLVSLQNLLIKTGMYQKAYEEGYEKGGEERYWEGYWDGHNTASNG